MDKLHLDPVEERLYIACSNEYRIKKHRQKTMLVTVLYAIVFAMLTFMVPLSRFVGIVIAVLLIVWAFITAVELRHMANLIFYYQSLNRKLLTRLKEKGADPELYEKRLADNEDDSFERKLARHSTVLALLFAAVMAVLQVIDPPRCNSICAIVTVLFVFVSAFMKISALNRIQKMKQIACAAGTVLNR